MYVEEDEDTENIIQEPKDLEKRNLMHARSPKKFEADSPGKVSDIKDSSEIRRMKNSEDMFSKLRD